MLRQGRHSPRDLGVEVALLLTVDEGLLDPIPLPRVREFIDGLGPWLTSEAGEVLARVRDSGSLTAEDRARLREVLARRASPLVSAVR